jgi:hypothetical protein
LLRRPPGPLQRRQKEGNQKRHDRNDNQQLDERERPGLASAMGYLPQALGIAIEADHAACS